MTNAAGYVQQGIDLFGGRVHLEGGLRYDYFRFQVNDQAQPIFSGLRGGARLQPKATISYTPSDRVPATFYFNYGRGIASQDARGVVRRPSGPTISTTDFYQWGASHNTKRFSFSTDLFLIDQSNQQVYIPDDGSIEFAGPSRTYGFEAKTSVQIHRFLAFSGGLTQVSNAFYRSTRPRIYVDSAPHTVANAGLTFSGYRGLTGALRYRHISNYRLDGEDAQIRAAGHDVLDLSFAKRIRSWMSFNFSIDNLTNKRYFETQNYFESRLRPGDEVISRIHGTPGYPLGLTVGCTFHLFGEK
ncbi:MAG: TonB-dependent receptor [Pyrinomonadaceae bacterium]